MRISVFLECIIYLQKYEPQVYETAVKPQVKSGCTEKYLMRSST